MRKRKQHDQRYRSIVGQCCRELKHSGSTKPHKCKAMRLKMPVVVLPVLQDGSVGRRVLPLHTATSKLQLKYRTTIRTIRIELNGSLTTKKLKKPHPSRMVGGAQMWNGLVPHPHVVKIREDYLRSEKSQPHTRPSTQGSSARKINPTIVAPNTSGDGVNGRNF